MNEKLAKKEFIKNFEYFKRNTAEYDKKRNPFLLNVMMWLFAPYLLLMVAFMFLPLFLIPDWYYYLTIGYVGVAVVSFIIMHLIYEFKNMKAITFDAMVYKGKLEDLFNDTKHPVIVNAEKLLEYEKKKHDGITGSTAYYLYEEINKKEQSEKAINIQSTTEKITMKIEDDEVK